MNALNELENAGKYTGIEHRILELTTPVNSKLNLKGKFFYLTFRQGKITEKEFAKFIYDKIIRYCIPRKKYINAVENYNQTGDERYFTELHDQARNLFVKSLKNHGAQLGEPGELIAFIILEAFFNAPQIACKMFLKTSEKMPIHGTDSVHIRMSETDESLELFWGEAKLYQQISSAFDKAIESIQNFLEIDNESGRKPRDRDIDIIKDFPNVTNENMKKALCNYFDPYSEFSNKWKEVFFCLIGFDYDVYGKLKGASDEEIENKFKSKYMERIKTALELFEKDIEDKKLTELEFILVLLPFENLNNFRKEFFSLLGITKLPTEDNAND